MGINLLDVFTLNRLFAPEQAVFIGFGKGQRQHFVAAFLPDLLRQFLIVVGDFENRLGNFRCYVNLPIRRRDVLLLLELA